MKYLSIYLTLIFSALLGCACNVVEPVEEEQTHDTEAAFRATTFVSGAEDITWAKWEANKDKIGVFASNESGILCVNRYFHAFSSTAASQFKSADHSRNRIWEEEGSADVYAYYPFRTSYTDPEAIPCVVPYSQILAPDMIPDIKSVVLYDAKADVSYAEALPQLQLKPYVSILKVRLSLSEQVRIDDLAVTSSSNEPLAFEKGTLNLHDGAITALEGVSQQIILTPSVPLAIGPEGVVFYFMVAPGHDGHKLSIKAQIRREEHEIAVLEVPEGGLMGGTMYSYEPSYVVPEKPYVNLSAERTANTYIVNRPSEVYGFDVRVKGNGQAHDFSWTFDGQPCNVSWGDVDIKPHSVGILWYNTPKGEDGQWTKVCPVVPESVDYDSEKGICYFSTPEKFVNGNVMIAAFDEAGEILWSWNIWAVEGYDADMTARNVGRFVVMDRNLGAFAGVEASRESDPVKAAYSMPKHGMFNLHASLLPEYRGAAPINWAIINGDRRTGVTTFLLNHEIDKGAIIEQEAVDIADEDNIGTLYDRLMHVGSDLVVKTVEKIAAGDYTTIEQMHVDERTLRPAPKIFKDDCRIDWQRSGRDIVNLVRGLSPYPAAWSPIYRDGAECGLAKLFKVRFEADEKRGREGSVVTDSRNYFGVRCADGVVYVEEVQMAGKRRMTIKELLLGWRDAADVSMSE